MTWVRQPTPVAPGGIQFLGSCDQRFVTIPNHLCCSWLKVGSARQALAALGCALGWQGLVFTLWASSLVGFMALRSSCWPRKKRDEERKEQINKHAKSLLLEHRRTAKMKGQYESTAMISDHWLLTAPFLTKQLFFPSRAKSAPGPFQEQKPRASLCHKWSN